MKIIFLDIDGVLNNDSDDILWYKDYGFYCPNLIDKLNTIIKHTGASIVLSSTWRLGLTDEEAEVMLKGIGVEGTYLGMTESFNNGFVFRGNEIYKWIKDHEDLVGKYYEFKDYIILDDDSDMLYWQRNNFIQTNGLKGLTDSNVMEAIAILNGERGESCGVNEYIIDLK